jgi:hypothetical protein
LHSGLPGNGVFDQLRRTGLPQASTLLKTGLRRNFNLRPIWGRTIRFAPKADPVESAFRFAFTHLVWRGLIGNH